MSEEDFNMSMRKFLKQVGVTSQREIEEFVRSGAVAGRKLRLKMTHVVEDDIDLP